jgi:hypothetical protein
MTAKDVLIYTLKMNQHFVEKYLDDLSDADLLVRPVPGANHIAWQLGHLISAEANVFQSKLPGTKPCALPEGFAKQHAKDMATSDTGFLTKEEYLGLYRNVRKTTLQALESFPDADLGKDPQMGWGDMAPTFASVFAIIANHDMMHGGQFTVVRRCLGKPVMF